MPWRCTGSFQTLGSPFFPAATISCYLPARTRCLPPWRHSWTLLAPRPNNHETPRIIPTTRAAVLPRPHRLRAQVEVRHALRTDGRGEFASKRFLLRSSRLRAQGRQPRRESDRHSLGKTDPPSGKRHEEVGTLKFDGNIRSWMLDIGGCRRTSRAACHRPTALRHASDCAHPTPPPLLRRGAGG